MEVNGDERGLEEDSSDDEDDPLVPRDCDSYSFSQLSVNPGENVSWEYRENAVSVGAMYKSALEVKDAVKRWSTLTLQREFRAGLTEPVGTSPETVGIGPTGPDRFRFRPVPNRSKFKF
jgi:hypothetical protein